MKLLSLTVLVLLIGKIPASDGCILGTKIHILIPAKMLLVARSMHGHHI